MGRDSEPESEDFAKINPIFDRAVGELQAAGAVVIDPVVIPQLQGVARAAGLEFHRNDGGGVPEYFSAGAVIPPFRSLQEMTQSADFPEVFLVRAEPADGLY